MFQPGVGSETGSGRHQNGKSNPDLDRHQNDANLADPQHWLSHPVTRYRNCDLEKGILFGGTNQGFGSVFILNGSGSGILGWIPIRIRIQSGSKDFFNQNFVKKLPLKKLHLIFIKTTIYLSLGLHKGRPSYKRSLQLSKENIHHFKT
jgi:hypothetical protein